MKRRESVSEIFWPSRFIQAENTPQAGTEHVALDADVDLRVLDDAAHEQLRHVRVVGEEVEEPSMVWSMIALRSSVLRPQRLERVRTQIDELVEDVAEDGDVERLLRRPVIVQARDVDAGAGGDLARRGALEPARGEHLLGGRQDARLGRSGRLARLLERRLAHDGRLLRAIDHAASSFGGRQ